LGAIYLSSLRAKKQYEQFLLETFLKASSIAAEVLDSTSEAPDFLIGIHEGVVGVELTELFTDRVSGTVPLQAQESIAQRVVARAGEIYRTSGAQHAHVSVHFSSGSDLRKLNRDQLSAELAAFVQGQALSVGQLVQWRPDYVARPFADVITFLQMLGVPEASMTHWSAPSAGWVAPLTAEVLQARIDEKGAHLPNYSKRAKENWLVLVSDGARPSQFFDPPTREVASAVSSPFDRTFYFARFRGIVIELATNDDA
jgi:hypothetical protein